MKRILRESLDSVFSRYITMYELNVDNSIDNISFYIEKNNEFFLPDYNDSILNLSCSILNHYGIAAKHPGLPEVDSILSQNFKHVVVILLDGLGMNILENNSYLCAFTMKLH